MAFPPLKPCISASVTSAFLPWPYSPGCAAKPTSDSTPAHERGMLVQHATDVLIDGVSYTRSNSREVAGWCWNDKQTEKLAYAAQAQVGAYEGVEVALPTAAKGTTYVSCSWHTHPWGSHVVPGPSKQDLNNSTHPSVRGITHFVVDQHGIWQYKQGRVIEMCPWNNAETNFDAARCRS